MSSGQAALEFISTYGFAFMALLLTLGAISYFGIFNPSMLRSEDCRFPRGFDCQDKILNKADPAGTVQWIPDPATPQPYVRMILYNTYGVNLTINNITILADKDSVSRQCGVISGAWAPGTNRTVWCTMNPATYLATERYEGAITMNFSQQAGSYQHIVLGAFSLTAQ